MLQMPASTTTAKYAATTTMSNGSRAKARTIMLLSGPFSEFRIGMDGVVGRSPDRHTKPIRGVVGRPPHNIVGR